jgi:ATP-binding cassette subfamily B protein
MMAVLGLVMAIFSQKLIDDILPSKNINRLILGIVLVALLLSARVGLSAARQWLLNRQSRDFNNRLMHDFFAKLLHLPKPFFDTRKIGDLTTRLHDTARIQRVISQLTNQVLIDVLVIVVSMVFLFFYNVQIALIALCCLPIIFWVIYAFNRLIIDSQREVMQSFAMVESNYIDTVQGISDIKTFNKVDYFNHKNQLKYGTLQDKIFDLGKVQIRLSFLSGITSVAFLTAVLGISSYFVFYKVIELGVLMAILTISGNILSSVVSLALLIIPIQEAKVAFDRIVELTLGSCLHEPKSAVVVCEDTNHGKDEDTNHGKDEDTNHGKREDTNHGNEKLTEITDKKIPLSDIKSLELKNIAYRFAGRSQLLKDINLTTKKGEITTLTGESGSGKSTLLQIIAGFYTSEKGQLLFNETPFSQISMDDFRQKVAYIPQSIKLFNASLLENISLSDSEEELSKVITFCQQYGFEKYFQSLPQGYLTFLGENGIHLSGGQSQLLALARALYHQPQLLLLDESTSAMDKHTEAFIIQLLQSLQTEMIVIWISHKPEINHLGNSVYKIENGLSTLVENKQAQIQDN